MGSGAFKIFNWRNKARGKVLNNGPILYILGIFFKSEETAIDQNRIGWNGESLC